MIHWTLVTAKCLVQWTIVACRLLFLQNSVQGGHDERRTEAEGAAWRGLPGLSVFLSICMQLQL